MLSPEFPPTIGGISGYVAQLAQALVRAGDRVDVWAKGPAAPPATPGLTVHSLPAGFDRHARSAVTRALRAETGSVILLEFVPYGMGGFPPAFLGWLARMPHPLWLMFHEVAYPFERGQSWRRHALALLTHAQAGFLFRRAERVFLSTDAWRGMLAPFGKPRRHPEVLPIASNLPARVPVERTREVLRAELDIPADAAVVGHFGTFGSLVAGPLTELVLRLWSMRPDVILVVVGRSSHVWLERLPRERRALVRSLDEVTLERAAEALSMVDVVLCPFPDGATTRRTTLMGALSLGKAVVTNDGRLTEAVWRHERCVELTPDEPARMAEHCAALLSEPERRRSLGLRAAEVYERCFSLDTTVRALRAARAP